MSATPGFPWIVPPGMGDVPVGAVLPFAGTLWPPCFDPATSPPTVPPETGVSWPIEAWGWMACDGRFLDPWAYPELFAALGFLYGKQDVGGIEQFALPDYRGYFLRGLDGGRGVDPDATGRSPPAGEGGSAEGVGSTQGFALQDHAHDYQELTPTTPAQQGGPQSAPTGQDQLTSGAKPLAPSSPPIGVSPNETRPINIYVNFIIKFTGGLWPSAA